MNCHQQSRDGKVDTKYPLYQVDFRCREASIWRNVIALNSISCGSNSKPTVGCVKQQVFECSRWIVGDDDVEILDAGTRRHWLGVGCQETGETGGVRRLFDVVVTRQRRLRVGIDQQHPPIRVCYMAPRLAVSVVFPTLSLVAQMAIFHYLSLFALPGEPTFKSGGVGYRHLCPHNSFGRAVDL